MSSCELVDFVEVLQWVCWSRFDGWSLWLPVCRTHLPVLLYKLESFDQSQSLVHTATNRKIIDAHLSDNTTGVDDEQSSQSNASLLDQHSVVSGDVLVEVWHQGIVEATQPSLFARLVDPGQVRKVTVSGDSDNLAVDLRELLDPVREGDDLRGTDEGEVERVEVDNKVFALDYESVMYVVMECQDLTL